MRKAIPYSTGPESAPLIPCTPGYRIVEVALTRLYLSVLFQVQEVPGLL